MRTAPASPFKRKIRRTRELPAQAVLQEWFHYDAHSGVFTWIKDPPRKIGPFLGKAAGNTTRLGYWYIPVPGYGRLAAHNLAWVYMNGCIPCDLEVDHIDGSPSNNAASNLRLATPRQQGQNKKVRSDSLSGLKGASYDGCRRKKKWKSKIMVGGKYVALGYFHTPEEAHVAYCEAALKHFGEFARTA
jgi:hypothetical protein